MSSPNPRIPPVGLRPEGYYTPEGESVLRPGAASPGRSVLTDFTTSPGATAMDFTEEQVSQVRAVLDNDLFIFAQSVCGFTDLTEDYHGPICRFLENWGRTDLPGGSVNFGWKRLMLEISRDTFKTTVGTIANALQVASKDPTGMTTIGIFNAKEGRTHAWIRTIRLIIEGSRFYQRMYRERIPTGVGYWDTDKGVSQKRGAKWSDAAIELERDRAIPEATISGHGATGSAAGWHFSHMIKDDLIELKHARSDVEMKAVDEWCETARYLEKPADQGCELWNYTRWHKNDIYARARKRWPDDYVVYHRDALETDEHGVERSSFPERMPTAFLVREREEKPFWFHSQRNNNPRAGRETAFLAEWRRYGNVIQTDNSLVFSIESDSYDPRASVIVEDAPRQIPLWWCHKALFWDPAPSEEADRNRESNARNGMLAVARDPWGRWLLLEASATRLDPVPTLSLALELAFRWGITQIHVEEVNFSKVYKHFAMRLLQLDPEYKQYREAGIQFIPQKAEKRHKDARIDGLRPDTSAGLVYLNRPDTQLYMREESDYPHGETRDLLDAFAMRQRDTGSYVIPRPETPDEYIERTDYEHVRRAVRSSGAYDFVNWSH